MEDRKARLAALAAKAGRKNDSVSNRDEDDAAIAATGQPQHRDDNNDSHPDGNTSPKKRKIHFRNYIPSDPKLSSDNEATGAIATNVIQNQSSNTDSTNIKPTTSTTKSPLQLALEKAKSEILNAATTTTNQSTDGGGISASGISISNISKEHLNNHKINADLKKRIQSKLQLLEKRTQKALVSILREKLEHEATVQSSITNATNSNSNDLD